MMALPSALAWDMPPELTGESIIPGESTIMKPSVRTPSRTLSCVWWMRVGPNWRNPSKPMSGSPTRAGPSWSTSAGPGAMTVKQSSVGATPAVWTGRPRTKLMKDDFPEEWLPTRKTNGRDVPRSEFLARGPPRLAFIGIMDEWRCEHFDSMACCAELDGTPPPSACAAPAVSSLDGGGVGAGVTFFDQFQVDRGRSRRHELLPKAGPSLVANAATGPLGRRHRIAIAALILCGARLRAVTGSDVPPRPNVYEAECRDG
mmetsp:Transcript_32846/g.74383  ORF Transcript_32846/g.74383 Transcript_32846/m.74383 type:complete len:259 (-) Transcript_32846:162-938(-)